MNVMSADHGIQAFLVLSSRQRDLIFQHLFLPMRRLQLTCGRYLASSTQLLPIQSRHSQRRHLRWVPVAYRGALVRGSSPPWERSGSIDNKSSRQGTKNPRLTGRNHKRHFPQKSKSPSQGNETPSSVFQQYQEAEQKLQGLHQDLLRLAKEYRSMFSSEPLFVDVRSDGATGVSYQDKVEEKKAIIRAVCRDVKELCEEIHRADRLVEWPQMERSEDLFRGFCRVLQDMIQTSLKMRADDAAAATRDETLALAEIGLGTLVKVVSERALLVELTKTWSPTNAPQPDSSSTTTPLKAFVGVLLEDTTSKSDHQQRPKENQPMAHEDPQVGASPALFRDVMNSIASDVKEQVASLASSERSCSSERFRASAAKVDQKEIESTARRMTALLDVMPSTWVPDIDTMNDILEMLCRAGTLSSARFCNDTFSRHPINKNRIRFSLVLQAYLEAAKRDPDDANRVKAAREAVAVLRREWNDNLPKHRVERIAHTSIVLNCLCEAAGTKSEGQEVFQEFCETADILVRQCLSREGYTRLQEYIRAPSSTIDPQMIPLVSCWARLYASSSDNQRVLYARQLLSYLMRSDRHNVGLYISTPLVDTFNAVLSTLVADFVQNAVKSESDEAAGATAINYATTALDFMLSRRESGCWPNELTFQLIFRLLLAVRPPDIGKRAEDFLSKLETRRYYSRESEESMDLSLSMYHRVLRCWLEGAKDPHVLDAPERAWKLVEKLEVQSVPLLLSVRETQLPSVPSNLYSIHLRPTRKTYGLVLRICLESPQAAKAVDVALRVHGKLQQRGMFVVGGSEDRIIQDLMARLKPEERAGLERRPRGLPVGAVDAKDDEEATTRRKMAS